MSATTSPLLLPTPEVTLTLATLSDLPFLVEILSQSYLPETVAQFYLQDWPSLTPLRPFFEARLERRFSQETASIFKLTAVDTGEIVGTVCLCDESAETEEKVRDPKNLEGHKVPPKGINLEFAMALVKMSGPLENLMLGKRHLLVTSFGVLPKYQGRGLGSKLLNKCNEVADEKKLPLFLSAFPGAYDLYVKHGYEEIGHGDIDLGKFGKPYRGFGIYRSYAMLREPGGKK